ncbi:TetR family transcriptional regulator [Nocardia panacis]|uniref:TetR family transcriptional regulator n=1 Tax=Nocardia panacis TaxID=2340916 RepID=A0A3A4JVV0_9NOCA|nr:TetR family transcriptional regulator [Nocardia panacis]RJO70712.1 TetR family transcriptional regulator [Nocardia panacis]
MTDARAPLRERKKQRARQALIDTALDLFTERGFDNTTLDELCDTVDISKRTFFRNFTSKEDVAMAPLRDLWTAFPTELSRRDAGTEPLRLTLQNSLLAALALMPQDWAPRAARSHRLARSTPSMSANNLQFCDNTIRDSLDTLRARYAIDPRTDQRPRLALDIVVAAFHCAIDNWIADPGDLDAATLAAHMRVVFDAIPDALTMVPAPVPVESNSIAHQTVPNRPE